MSVLFPQADASQSHTNAKQLQDLLLAWKHDLHQGIVEISYPGNEQLVLFFVDKAISCVYSINSAGRKSVPPSEYAAELKDEESDVRLLPMPLEGIRIGKAMLECSHVEQTSTIPTANFKRYLEDLARLPNPSLVRANWPEAEAIFIIPGNKIQIQDMLFISREQILARGKALARSISWHEPSCEITSYTSDMQSDACLVCYLHIYFIFALEAILGRYSELAGGGLTNMVSEAINNEATKNNWHINTMDGSVLDQEIFSSPQSACLAYQALMNVCVPQVAMVIGKKLTQTIIQSIFSAIGATGREILQKYPFIQDGSVIDE